MRVPAAALLLALVASAHVPAAAQDAAPPAPAAPQDPAKARKMEKIRRYLDLSRSREAFFAGFDAAVAPHVKAGRVPRKFLDEFRKSISFDDFAKLMIEILDEVYEEETLDALNAFLDSPAGRKYAEVTTRLPAVMMEKVQPWAEKKAQEVLAKIMEQPADGEEGDDAISNLRKAKRNSNEIVALASLRNLATCQAQIQTTGKIDCDADGIGEFGTFLELTGSVGCRKGTHGEFPPASDFSKVGTPVSPAILSARFADVDGEGVARRNGYCFRIYLPDAAVPVGGFVHEVGPKDKVGLAGGTRDVGVDLSECTWCAYAWPEKKGDTGDRVFFVNQSGDVLESANGKTKWEGAKAPPPAAAFRGDGITAEVAVGTVGRDGEIWKVSN